MRSNQGWHPILPYRPSLSGLCTRSRAFAINTLLVPYGWSERGFRKSDGLISTPNNV